MRQINLLVFDEIVDSPSGFVSFYTAAKLNAVLGQYDQLAIQAIADNFVGSGSLGSLAIWIETSCDGIHWVPKDPSGTAQIPQTSLNPLTPTLLPWGFDNGTNPSYALVRLVMSYRAQFAPSCTHVKVYVTARDQGGLIHVFRYGTPHPQFGLPKQDQDQSSLSLNDQQQLPQNLEEDPAP